MARAASDVGLPAGDLVHRVTLQNPGAIEDSMGGRTDTWTTFAERIPAAADPMPSIVNEKEAAVMYLVRIRWRRGVTPEGGQLCLLYLAGDSETPITLKVLAAVNPKGRCRELQLTCGRATV